MPKKPTTETLAELRAKLAELPDEVRAIYNRGVGLRDIVADLKRKILLHSVHLQYTELTFKSIEHAGGDLLRFSFLDDPFKRYTHARLLLDVIEESDEFKEALKIIDPLRAEIAAKETELHQENLRAHNELQALKDRARALQEKAMKDLENNPEYQAALQKTDELRQQLNA